MTCKKPSLSPLRSASTFQVSSTCWAILGGDPSPAYIAQYPYSLESLVLPISGTDLNRWVSTSTSRSLENSYQYKRPGPEVAKESTTVRLSL